MSATIYRLPYDAPYYFVLNEFIVRTGNGYTEGTIATIAEIAASITSMGLVTEYVNTGFTVTPTNIFSTLGYDYSSDPLFGANTGSSNSFGSNLYGNMIALELLSQYEGAGPGPSDHSPVSVNFNILVDAASSVSVFGDEFTDPNNIVIAQYNLPVNALYDSVETKGLLEMWEPADAQGYIKAKLASTNSSSSGGADLTDAYKITLKKLAKGLQKVLCDKLDCSDAAPFSDAKYSGVEDYTVQRDFGRLALGTLAHYFFGHVDATAAITNDAEFVKAMLSITAGEQDEDETTGPDARYASWTKAQKVDDIDIANWASDNILNTASASDANLAVRLVRAIYEKGISGGSLVESSIADNNTSSLANMVKQVIGQDAQRTKNVDGSERTINARQLVRFYPGDVIYVNIKVKRPEITVGAGQSGISQSSLLNNYLEQNEQNYAIKITLGARDASL